MIKDMMNVITGVALGGATLGMIGSSSMASGLKSATQSIVSIGIMTPAIKMVNKSKDIFKL